MKDHPYENDDASANLPGGFGFEDEHPSLAMPFTVRFDGRSYGGEAISVTELVVNAPDASGPEPGSRHVALLTFPFENFAVTLTPELRVVKTDGTGQTVLAFTDPTGPHLSQLRFILNSVIAGNVMTLNGMLAYTGPTRPKAEGPAAKPSVRDRARSIAVAAVSAALVLTAAGVVWKRTTTGVEMHPVFVSQEGQQMRATSPGQLSYLNPEAEVGEVAYSINSNTGDVLNFRMPCDCDATLANGIYEGATVLPTDLILTILTNNKIPRVQTLISIEGLARAMDGDNAYLDLNDGRTIPVEVVVTDATDASTLKGDEYVPVELEAAEGVLDSNDIGKAGRLRLTRPLASGLGL